MKNLLLISGVVGALINRCGDIFVLLQTDADHGIRRHEYRTIRRRASAATDVLTGLS